MNRLKADQKTKVGKRKVDNREEMESDVESGVKTAKIQHISVTGNDKKLRIDNQTHYNFASSSSRGLVQSTDLSKNPPKNSEKILRQFVQWTQAAESLALNFLAKANWNIEYAMTLYYDNPQLFSGATAHPTIDRNKIERLFSQYVNPRDNFGDKRIGPNGIFSLLSDLKIDPTNRRALVLAWKFNAQTQCEFSLEEWVNGMTALQADSIESLRQRIEAIDSEINSDKSKFRELYVFTFNYGKPAACRSLDIDIAICYWDVLFGSRSTTMTHWIEFLINQENVATARLQQDLGAENAKKIKSVWITRDTWNLFWDFIVLSKPDLSDYDDEGAWPVLIDQFVDHCREHLNYPKPAKEGEEQQLEQPNYY